VDPDAFTQSLSRIAEGDPEAMDRLLPVVYAELRRLAAAYLRDERPGHTLQPTALVHEAFLRLAGGREPGPRSRAQFVGIAARTMRNILVDHARRRKAQKRGGGAKAVTLDTSVLADASHAVEIEDLDRVLEQLAQVSERQARVVELRYFGGFSIEETGDALGISPMTVKRDWAFARAWLYRELTGSQP
jgi:RNA polymerase sigma factor (TIGR02999 family)